MRSSYLLLLPFALSLCLIVIQLEHERRATKLGEASLYDWKDILEARETERVREQGRGLQSEKKVATEEKEKEKEKEKEREELNGDNRDGDIGTYSQELASMILERSTEAIRGEDKISWEESIDDELERLVGSYASRGYNHLRENQTDVQVVQELTGLDVYIFDEEGVKKEKEDGETNIAHRKPMEVYHKNQYYSYYGNRSLSLSLSLAFSHAYLRWYSLCTARGD